MGAIARAMKNFGVERLVLVKPCALGDEAEKRAMHGLDVLRSAKIVDSFEEALEGLDFAAATSGVATDTPRELSSRSLGTSAMDRVVLPTTRTRAAVVAA